MGKFSFRIVGQNSIPYSLVFAIFKSLEVAMEKTNINKYNHSLKEGGSDTFWNQNLVKGTQLKKITGTEVSENNFNMYFSVRYCDSRRKVLLNHVYEGYEKEWWDYTEAPTN